VKGLKHPDWPIDPWQGLKRLVLMLVEETSRDGGKPSRACARRLKAQGRRGAASKLERPAARAWRIARGRRSPAASPATPSRRSPLRDPDRAPAWVPAIPPPGPAMPVDRDREASARARQRAFGHRAGDPRR
jgi:hypothetical protein